MPKLMHSRDGNFVEEIELKEGTWLVGRRPECDIRLDDQTVSGKHAVITVRPSIYMKGLFDVTITDHNSTNGTVVNGKKIKEHMMKHDEPVFIGSHEFTLVDEKVRGFETTRVVLPEK